MTAGLDRIDQHRLFFQQLQEGLAQLFVADQALAVGQHAGDRVFV
jgi:hypothetical protein